MGANPNRALRSYVAANPATPLGTLLNLAADLEPAVRESAASNPNLPPDTVRRRAADISGSVRAIIAGNPATPAALICELALDTDFDVVDAVRAAHPDLAWDTHRPAYLRVENLTYYAQAGETSANPALFAALAPTWAGSTAALLHAVAGMTN